MSKWSDSTLTSTLPTSRFAGSPLQGSEMERLRFGCGGVFDAFELTGFSVRAVGVDVFQDEILELLGRGGKDDAVFEL